jgi:5-methylthioadenosine/S-adenosylhomocysteine deaminase
LDTTFDLIIKDTTVITMDRQYSVLEHVDVAVLGNRIVSVRPTNPEVRARKTILGAGYFLMPGFVNTHTHVGMAYFKGTAAAMELFKWLAWGWFYIQRMSPEDIYWAAKLSCIEMIRAGVTTFCDQYFSADRIGRAVLESGLRACISEGVMEPAPGMEARMPIDDQIQYGFEVFKNWNHQGEGRVQVFYAPHALYSCSAPTVEKILELANRTGTRLHIHVSETRKEVDDAFSLWKMSPPQRMEKLGMLQLPIIAAHCVHLSPEDIDLLDRSTFGVAHNPASNMKLQSGRAPIEQMVGRQMAVGLGSDGNGSNDIVDILKEVYLTAIWHPWREEQTPAHTALAMATREGARAIGLDEEIGSIEVGKKADMILIKMDAPRTLPTHDPHYALAFTGRGDDVRTTIVDGKVLMEDGQILVEDEQVILEEARRRSAEIFSVAFKPAS